jgi:eukaryotic-like serine/threonine-protein kinase
MPNVSLRPTALRAAPFFAAPAAEATAPRLNEFEMLALAGRGTFAEVWHVRDPQTGEDRALKKLRTDLPDQPAARRILANEAEIAGKVTSPHVVRLAAKCLDADPPCLVLEWLAGRTLETRLVAEKRIFCRDALWIARQCVQGMHALLLAGFSHGDIKPSNIFLCDDGTVKLIDLGFARPDRIVATELSDPVDRTVTGTPEYMAPEVLVRGESGGIARDVYSLGVTLYRMLTGSLPFNGTTIVEVLREHQQSLPPRLRSHAPEVPREVSEFVHRLLSKQPLRRGGGLSWLVRELIGLELIMMSDTIVRRTAFRRV